MPTLSFQNFTLTWGKLYITTLPYLKTDTCKDTCDRIELQIACVSLFCSDVHLARVFLVLKSTTCFC